MRETILLAATLSLALIASHCTPSFRQDQALASVIAGDMTALISTVGVDGCGSQVTPGIAYCRKVDGDPTTERLSFLGPPAECEGAGPCVNIQIFFPGGGPAMSLDIPRGQTRVDIPWSELTKKPAFDRGDRGFWTYNVKILHSDGDGHEVPTYQQGELLLRVYQAKKCDAAGACQFYTPLHESPHDPNFAWEWREGAQVLRVTTAGRAYAGKN